MSATHMDLPLDPSFVSNLKEPQRRHVHRVLTLMYTGQELPRPDVLAGIVAELANSWSNLER
ncbi:hypothetical protein [Micrococcoides hystricis]|uniref:Uncharacterized protein n=1 Tax=Micrococcoides hystricis TaxID=1572761 RepID=A0ABV6P9S2_9MICC